ncbi:MAG: DUF4340 domain-containing protein [Pirellulaceae bacterium]
MKNESTKTIGFVTVAALAAALAFWTYKENLPPASSGFEMVGQPFFEEFSDPKSAAHLEIAALDDSQALQTFVLKKSYGLWRIPTHSDYPAEAADRLAAASTSLIGLRREALVGRLATEHERFGVLDPKNSENNDPETTGKRLTLKDSSGQPLADLIIGKKIEKDDQSVTDRSFEAKQRDTYYVRKADEVQTYKASLNLNLSTRFSDWINTQLIDVSAPAVQKIRIDNYQLVNNPQDPLGTSRIKKVGDQLELTRDMATRSWSLAGIDAAKETVKAAEVDNVLDTLLDLKIIGVREKFRNDGKPLIGPDMKLIRDDELMKDQNKFGQLLQKVAVDLATRGFYLQAPERGDLDSLQMVSESGQISFSTNEGLVYTLDLGKSIEGDPKAIEIGTADSQPVSTDATKDDSTKSEAKKDGETSAEKTPDEKAEAKDADAAKADAAKEIEKPTTSGKNRFVLIRVTLDEKLVAGGPPVKPTEPVKPVQPEGYVPAAPPKTDEPKTDEPKTEAEKTDESREGDAAPPPEEKPQERDPKFIQYDLDVANYESAKTQYEIDLSRYERQVEQHKKSVESAQKKVNELNERFGAWYYVVSAFNLEKLRLERTALVEPVKPPEAPANPDNQPPAILNPADSIKPPEETTPPNAAEDKSKATEEKTGDNPPAANTAEKPAEKPADETPPNKDKDGGI